MTEADLIQTLVSDLKPIAPDAGRRDLALGLAAGAAVTVAALLFALGVQPGLGGAAGMAFMMKDAYALSLAALAFAGAIILGRPGARAPRLAMLLAPVAALTVLAGASLAQAPANVEALVMGGSWRQCALRIVALSLPVFVGVTLAMRRQAPTRLRSAGAAAGLLSGAVGAAVYAFACTESSPAFVLVWYSAGIAASTAVGALLGPRLLRW